MRRLLLVRHAPTGATRANAFPGDEPLDARGVEAASALRDVLPRGWEASASPFARCRETAAAAGFGDAVVDEALAECDFGAWVGRVLADIGENDPDGMRAWMTDPGACPHDGESMVDFAARTAAWLDAQARLGGKHIAFTHSGVIRGALVRAIAAPLAAFWKLDLSPNSVTELHAHDGRWTVSRVNWVPRRSVTEALAADIPSEYPK